MKRFFLAALSLVVISFSSCENESGIVPECVEVRVVAEICGNAVLQVVDGYQALNLETWTDSEGNVHQNTFSTFMNPCAENYPDDLSSTFFVTFADNKDISDCIVCLALLADMPETYFDIRFVEPCGLGQID